MYFKPLMLGWWLFLIIEILELGRTLGNENIARDDTNNAPATINKPESNIKSCFGFENGYRMQNIIKSLQC